jgi:hypothetical protein
VRLGWIRERLLYSCMHCSRNYLLPALLPKSLGNLQRINIQVLPSGHFVAGLMQLAMVATAERDGELVADFETQGSGLGKAQMVRIGRLVIILTGLH